MTRPSPLPVYFDPFVGGGGVLVKLLAEGLVPPVSWMGGKRRLALRILLLLGLHPGQRIPMVLGDGSWWGWVWPLCLDPVTGPLVSAWLRSWRSEAPRALWFRLRDAGPAEDMVERAAGLLWLQARAASGVPVWWEGDEVVSMDGHGRGPYRAWQNKAPALVQWASTKVDRAGQRQATEPRLLVQRDPNGQTRQNAGKGFNAAGAGGMIDPGTIATRLDEIRLVMAAAPIVIAHRDALDLVREWAPVLGSRARAYLDPPYLGCTGYPMECPREDVLTMADLLAQHGARVVLSEAVGLAAELGTGWREVCLRRGPKPEWVTLHGCSEGAEHGQLFAQGAA